MERTLSPTQANDDYAVPLSQTRVFRVGAMLLILCFVLVYALTLDTGLQPQELHGGDLITHQYAQVQARPSNAPGYPLYTMGGWLWFHGWRTLFQSLGVALPNPIPILSAYSALWALLALWLFYKVIGELLGNTRHLVAFTFFAWLLTAFFGATYFFWYYATTVEQYSSAVAQTVAIVYLYLLWDKAPARRGLVYWLAFLCGISLAHMLTVAFIVPSLVFAVLWRDPSLLRNARAVLSAIAAAALPLISYLYIYLRGALNPNWWGRGHWTSPNEWFISFVSTTQGRDELSWAFEPGRTFFGNGFPEIVWQELSLPLLALGLVGLSRLPRRHALFFYGTLALYALFCWLYRFGNWFQVVLPAYPLILLGIVPLYRLAGGGNTTRLRPAQTLMMGALVVTLIWRIDASLPAANSRTRPGDTGLDRAALLLDQPLPRNARLFAAVDDTLAIDYLTQIWGIRPDVKTLTSRDAEDDLSEGDIVFATVDALPALVNELTITPQRNGFSPDWVALAVEIADAPPLPDVIRFDYSVTPELMLAAYAVQLSPSGEPLKPPVTPGIDVYLVWKVETSVWPADLSISLRPLHQGIQIFDPATGQPVQQDRTRPVHGLWLDRPSVAGTNAESSNAAIEIIDPYRLLLPAPLNTQVDALQLILYRRIEGGFENVAEITLPLPVLNQ